MAKGDFFSAHFMLDPIRFLQEIGQYRFVGFIAF